MLVIKENNEKSLDLVISSLKSGNLVCFPTETVYALACDATNPNAIEKIYNLKRRDKSKPIAVFFKNLQTASNYLEIPKEGEISGIDINYIVNNMMPGPVTLVCGTKNNSDYKLAENISNNGKLGFRIPDHKFCLDLLNLYDMPIAATSANISGEQSAITVEEILESIGSEVDIIIDGGKSLIGVPSTVIDVSEKPFKLLRGDLAK